MLRPPEGGRGATLCGAERRYFFFVAFFFAAGFFAADFFTAFFFAAIGAPSSERPFDLEDTFKWTSWREVSAPGS